MNKWRVEVASHPYIIRKSYPNAEYLCPDGTIHGPGKSVNYYFKSKEEAEVFIEEWENGMSIDSKIEQCNTDIKKLQENLEQLKKEKKEAETPKTVDVYCDEVTVGVSGSFVLVYGRDAQASNSKTKGYPITPKEARKMAIALNEMADFIDKKGN